MRNFFSSRGKTFYLIGVAVLATVLGAGIFLFSAQKTAAGEEAYAGERTVTVWSRLSQVREPVVTLRYGEQVFILDHKKDQAQLRTASGAVGWTEQRYLMDRTLWNQAAALRARARDLPVQAHAHTRVPTNVHLDPGRSGARIFQFPSAVPLDILERVVAEAKEDSSASRTAGSAAQQKSADEPEAKKEDWVLVRGKTEQTGEVAGWVLRRFIDLDTPSEIADYAAGFRFVAWFELNHVSDSGKIRRQYLAAGAQGGNGQPCDFTLLRVYTWGTERQRYETAYVESQLCGRLPIRVEPAAAPGGDARFSFSNAGRKGDEAREYAMHQTSVHRVDLEKRRRAATRRAPVPRPHS